MRSGGTKLRKLPRYNHATSRVAGSPGIDISTPPVDVWFSVEAWPGAWQSQSTDHPAKDVSGSGP